MKTVRFTIDDPAFDAWHFNCGPAALCAVLDKTPDEIRPMLKICDFEAKGYTSPSMMFDFLKGHSIPYSTRYRGDDPKGVVPPLKLGLVRWQWGGRWCNPGVPMRARYRQTHWTAAAGDRYFDVNAICVGGWIDRNEWHTQLAPWLIRECVPNGDGTFWPTHAIELAQPDT